MDTQQSNSSSSRRPSARAVALRALQAAPGTPFRASDILDALPSAAARALSRLSRQGAIQRLRKGIYYIPKETLLGKSTPPDAVVIQKMLPRRARPTGITAANLLGMSTQMASQPEFVVYASSKPLGLDAARLYLRPHLCDEEIEPRDGALIEFIRDRGRYGELSANETCVRAREILRNGQRLDGGDREAELSNSDRLRRLRDVALREPPRVRAILGALMQSAGLPEILWRPLRESLNPLSRFDFGPFRALSEAWEWQAK
jgi:hypothetical protein